MQVKQRKTGDGGNRAETGYKPRYSLDKGARLIWALPCRKVFKRGSLLARDSLRKQIKRNMSEDIRRLAENSGQAQLKGQKTGPSHFLDNR